MHQRWRWINIIIQVITWMEQIIVAAITIQQPGSVKSDNLPSTFII